MSTETVGKYPTARGVCSCQIFGKWVCLESALCSFEEQWEIKTKQERIFFKQLDSELRQSSLGFRVEGWLGFIKAVQRSAAALCLPVFWPTSYQSSYSRPRLTLVHRLRTDIAQWKTYPSNLHHSPAPALCRLVYTLRLGFGKPLLPQWALSQGERECCWGLDAQPKCGF